MPAQKRAQETSEDDPPKSDHGCSDEDPEDEEKKESDRSLSSSSADKDEYVVVKLSEIRKEVQCPICLGIIRKTRTVMECLHRFCRECIDKSMRLGNNECPACRTHCASRRSLRDDPNYDALIAALYPNIDKYEEEELALQEEEKARNKQIQASIAQTFLRQSEALSKKRTPFVRRSRGNYRNAHLRGKRNYRNAELPGSDDDEETNGTDGGKDSSSSDEHVVPKPKRIKKRGASRFPQPSNAAASAADADGVGDENDSELNRETMSASVGLVSSSERFSWGKGGMRSHTRHGSSMNGSNGKNSRISRVSKLVDYLRNSNENNDELDVHLKLVSFNKQIIPDLPRPYICCRPTLSVRQICQYIAHQTAIQADEIEIFLVKEPNAVKLRSSTSEKTSISEARISDPSKDKLHVLKERQTLAEVQKQAFACGQLLLAYTKKLEESKWS